MRTETDKPEFVYVTYIETTPEKLWHALTDRDFSRRYWFGYGVQSSMEGRRDRSSWSRTERLPIAARFSNPIRRAASPTPGRRSTTPR